jgi:hypothetical protein
LVRRYYLRGTLVAGAHLDDPLASIAWEEVWFVIGAWFVAGLLLALP